MSVCECSDVQTLRVSDESVMLHRSSLCGFYLCVFAFFNISWSSMVMENKLKIRLRYWAVLKSEQDRQTCLSTNCLCSWSLFTPEQTLQNHSWSVHITQPAHNALAYPHVVAFYSLPPTVSGLTLITSSVISWVPGSGAFILQRWSWESSPTLDLENSCVFSLLLYTSTAR